METKPYRVLLYYLYVPIENHEEFAAEHLAACKELELKGRILVASGRNQRNGIRYDRTNRTNIWT